MMMRQASATAALLTATAVLLAPAIAPANAGTFSNLAGNWSGSGRLVHADGKTERLRCRASYSVGGEGNSVDLSIRCASDSYKFDLSGHMRSANGAISGQWSEPNYNSAGNLTGRASGSRINAHAIGNTFSARLSMTTNAAQQSVTIRPEATQIRQVSLTFRRR